MNWVKLINKDIPLSVLTKVSPTKGNMTYEYNPFYNYRIQLNMYEYKEGLYNLADLWNNFKITLKCKIIETDKDGEDWKEGIKYYTIITKDIEENYDYSKTAKIIIDAYKDGKNADKLNLETALKSQGKLINEWYSPLKKLSTETNPILREAGEITDFITNELSFDLEHPVHMLPLYSYDGSVNLILNDGINRPRLINSRFSATGKNTYEVCDRKGNNDTNLYDLGSSFDLDTSLYKQTNNIVSLKFEGTSQGGNLKVGNYHFYFKLSDADGNESDFVAESGLVSIFLGFDSYSSVTTGERDENSHKQVYFQLSNIDSSYDYVHVYYSRYTAENDLNRIIEYRKIEKDFSINNAQIANIYISGYEKTTDITAEDINLLFNVVDSSYTSAICLNRLFMANVHKPDIPYVELTDLSLRILPYLNTEKYDSSINENYVLQTSNKGYIDPKFIYEKTGYWTGELYRLGIVYIMPDNTLSPVFNIRGGCKIGKKENEESEEWKSENYHYYSKFDLYDEENKNRKYISINEETFRLIPDKDQGVCLFENSKGVVSFESNQDTNIINSIEIIIPNDVKQELAKYVKGYFFVRQPRIPLVLAQGITIGINKESNTPTIPTKDGFVNEIANQDLSKTHVTVGEDHNGTSKIDEVVYVSEGFLSRYKFKFKEKSSHVWGKIGKIVGITVAVIGLAAASVVMAGVPLMTAATVIGGGLAGVIGGSVTAIGATAIIAGGVIVGSAVIPAIVATGQELLYAVQRIGGKSYNRWDTKIPSGYEIDELDDSRLLTHNFEDRVIMTALDQNNIAGIICPDYELDQPHFNNIFIGDKHRIETTISQGINLLNNYGDNYFTNNGRHFYIPDYYDANLKRVLVTEVVGITDNLKLGIIKDFKYRARAGEAEEAFRIESVGSLFKSLNTKDSGIDDEETINNRKINSDIIRGSFGPYLGFYDKDNTFAAAETVNIYTSGYDPSKLESYVYQRCCDSTTFYTISDRFVLNTNEKSILVGEKIDKPIMHTLYRGDCYICLFTHRINRNFQDPSAPLNDDIIEEKTWKDNYDPGNSENLDLINLGDVNAVKMGMWVTFKVRSSNNLNIRTQDSSYAAESAMSGTSRTYYPKTSMSVDGTYKIPESSVFNSGFKKLLGERYNYEIPDVPWIKNWFGTRIMYSNINVSDSFLNGFRVFKGLNYRDYTREYGSITKLISLESNLLCVFEHGVALIPVNERTVAGEGAGGFAYINTLNVLPENPKILSDVFGSQWADSILKVPGKFGDNVQYVYGVDTVAKKIWRTDGNTLTCISDFKVLEFLNNNISLSLNELNPKIGIRNVKTFYNAFKRDVMFTFYDNTYGFEEKVWNLCWNELLQQFVTFYSWVPSVMENINNIPFSFNRNTSKWIAKLGTSHSNNSFSDGITLSNVIVNNIKDNNEGYSDNYKVPITYKTIDGGEKTIICEVAEKSRLNLIGVLNLSNRTIPELEYLPEITYSIERDLYKNYKMFDLPKDIKLLYKNEEFKLPSDAKFAGQTIKVQGLYFKPEYNVKDLMSEIYYRNARGHVYPDEESDKDGKIKISIYDSDPNTYFDNCIEKQLPIFKNSLGKRLTLEKPYRKNKIVTLLNLKATVKYKVPNDNSMGEDYYNAMAGLKTGTTLIDAGYYESVVAIIPQWNLSLLSTDFWRHGLAGIFDIADKIYPTYWYGEQHPFEFEFIVANDPGKHKIFDNLLIISNKAAPESFHYEIVGECYDFAKDKKNMYIRQEATKELYQYNGSDIIYNHNYTDLKEARRDLSTGLELSNDELGRNLYDKSTIFPLYYGRQDHINEIYDSYNKKYEDTDFSDFSALAGAELILYSNLNEIRIWNHCRAVDVAKVDLVEKNKRKSGLLRGNMLYKEDLWNILINPLNFILRNEPDWSYSYSYSEEHPASSSKIPVELNTFSIPDDIKNLDEVKNKGLDFPPSFKEENKERGVVSWPYTENKLAKLKDKYLKVRIRYSGEDLAIINAINTLYSISFA